ncbi:MAG TPA: helix-turn-helix domain-containing protein [Rhodothermales bacterium]|nr:helix-turn-helix domain-containing protein [Rhodothermales bacterium]
MHGLVEVDGKADEWADVPYKTFSTPSKGKNRRNVTQIALAWDGYALYAYFTVRDRHLIALPKDKLPIEGLVKPVPIDTTGRTIPIDTLAYLYLNDSVELYVHTKGEPTSTFSSSDYHLVTDLLGRTVVLRGNPVSALEAQLPKVVDQDVVYYVKSIASGSANMNDDEDDGYVVEMMIPWASLGLLEAKSWIHIRLLAGNNDNDGEGLDIIKSAWCGVENQDAAINWTDVKLVGQATWWDRIQKAMAFSPWLLVGGVLGGVLTAWLLWQLLIRLLRRLKPTKMSFPPDTDSVEHRKTSLPVTETKPIKTVLPEEIAPTVIPRPIEVVSADVQFLKQMQNLIERRIDDPRLNVAELAQALNISPRQLQRKIQSLTGVSPVLFLRNYRLERAKHLLEQGAGSISEVAYAVGFNTPDYFAKVFKEQYGVQPSQYIKTVHQELPGANQT